MTDRCKCELDNDPSASFAKPLEQKIKENPKNEGRQSKRQANYTLKIRSMNVIVEQIDFHAKSIFALAFGTYMNEENWNKHYLA